MNQAQVKYARTRIDDIAAKKRLEIQDKFTVQKPIMSFEDKIEAIKAGQFAKGKYDGLDYIVFDALKDEGKERRELDKKKELDAVGAFKTKLLDELMLGDSEEALKAIQDFENFKVGK